jgi:hypothetical protein
LIFIHEKTHENSRLTHDQIQRLVDHVHDILLLKIDFFCTFRASFEQADSETQTRHGSAVRRQFAFRRLVHHWLQNRLKLSGVEAFVKEDLVDWRREFGHELEAQSADFDQQLDAAALLVFFREPNCQLEKIYSNKNRFFCTFECSKNLGI